YDPYSGGYSPLPPRTEQRGPVEPLGDVPDDAPPPPPPVDGPTENPEELIDAIANADGLDLFEHYANLARVSGSRDQGPFPTRAHALGDESMHAAFERISRHAEVRLAELEGRDAPSPEELVGLGPSRAEVFEASEALPTVRGADGYPIDARELLFLAISTDSADHSGIPRAAFLAEYQGGDYDDWLIEQIERDHGLTGLTKAHIDQLLADLREHARRGLPETIVVYRGDDGERVENFDRADLGPVSVAHGDDIYAEQMAAGYG
ncbi:uncharacterized protein METZ01_LOCUS437017, partial [marine metagenome]